MNDKKTPIVKFENAPTYGDEKRADTGGASMSGQIENTNEIVTFFHCGLCLAEKPEDVSPRTWAQLDIGYTRRGIQVWCKRHECNLLHIDFEGTKHPANTSRQPRLEEVN